MLKQLSDSMAPQDRRNVALVWGFAMLWAFSSAGVTFLLKRNLLPAGTVASVAAAVPMIVSGFVIWSHIHYFRYADELQRRIQLNAMAVGFGVTVMVTLSYTALELAGAPSLDREMFVILGVLTYVASYLYWSGRYR